MTVIDAVVPGNVSRQHARVGGIGSLCNEGDLHARYGVHTEKFEGDRVAVAGPDQNEIPQSWLWVHSVDVPLRDRLRAELRLNPPNIIRQQVL